MRAMRPIFKQFLAIISIGLTLAACANRGSPEGGPKDEEPPKIIKSEPPNYSTNFRANEIRIYFDEYIKIKDLQKQLIISPPMDTEPTVTPLGTAAKYIKIIINDTLEENTTYAFNFGRSILDNNEENPYDYYRYVFSTGDYIDSLQVVGTVLDAYNRKPDNFVSVMLYEVDSTYTDSIVYKEKPKYITNTLDSLKIFSIDNIREGTYKMVAIKEENANFTYQQKTDKIGFVEKTITIPTDSFFTITMFKEVLDFNLNRPKQEAGQKIAFGYEGNGKEMNIELLGDRPADFEKRITKDPKTDTLYYWYKPKIELDSAQFLVTNLKFQDTLKHVFRELDRDSLTIKAEPNGTLDFGVDYGLVGTTPFVGIDENLISMMDKDSVQVAFSTRLDTLNNKYIFDFERQEAQAYNIQLLPEAVRGFFGGTNDTLNFTVRTKKFSDYGNIRLTLQNAKYPVIAQLVDDKSDVKYEKIVEDNRPVDFFNLLPAKYYLRVVVDANENGKWDTGDYLQKIQPEKIYYRDGQVEVRANFDNVEEFILPQE